MPKYSLALLLIVIVAGCGGGSDGEADGDMKFIEQVPTEETLCSLIPGVSTRAEVEEVLGEPTHYTESPASSILQYWYGSLQEFGRGNVKVIVVSFDSKSILESPSVDGLPFPSCWRAGASSSH